MWWQKHISCTSTCVTASQLRKSEVYERQQQQQQQRWQNEKEKIYKLKIRQNKTMHVISSQWWWRSLLYCFLLFLLHNAIQNHLHLYLPFLFYFSYFFFSFCSFETLKNETENKCFKTIYMSLSCH